MITEYYSDTLNRTVKPGTKIHIHGKVHSGITRMLRRLVTDLFKGEVSEEYMGRSNRYLIVADEEEAGWSIISSYIKDWGFENMPLLKGGFAYTEEAARGISNRIDVERGETLMFITADEYPRIDEGVVRALNEAYGKHNPVYISTSHKKEQVPFVDGEADIYIDTADYDMETGELL